jgi:hypothetical protein
MANNDFFNILSYITFEKKPWNELSDSEKESVNPFLLHRYISLYEPYIELADLCQCIPSNDKKMVYNAYINLLPKKKVWNKFIKSTKKKSDKNLLNYLSQYFECSNREIEDYLNFLPKDEVKFILEKMNVEDKEIKKILK